MCSSVHTFTMSSPHDSHRMHTPFHSCRSTPYRLDTSLCHGSKTAPMRQHRLHPPVLAQVPALTSSHTRTASIGSSDHRIQHSDRAGPVPQPTLFCNISTPVHTRTSMPHASSCAHILPPVPPSFRSSHLQKTVPCRRSAPLCSPVDGAPVPVRTSLPAAVTTVLCTCSSHMLSCGLVCIAAEKGGFLFYQAAALFEH